MTVSPAILARGADLRARFQSADPFAHVPIDDFFDEAFARELLAQFPPFSQIHALDEFGRVGGKAVVSALATLSPAYRRVHEEFSSQPFLDWLSATTGIPGLLYDEENFGGGTHENIDGQGLLPHVDFNYHPTTHFHRRINLIVYLNEGWDARWGGSIRFHSDPRSPSLDRTQAYTPDFNRCVIFETSERSWHSFDRIVLPPTQRERTRKSLSIYFYTRERPDDLTYADHTTFYIPRPVPPELQTGRTLSDADMATLNRIVRERDELLEIHQRREAEREPATVEANRARIRITELCGALRVPLMGYVRQTGATKGLYDDGWAGAELEFAVEPACDVIGCTLRADVPEHVRPGNCIWFELDGATLGSVAAVPGPIELHCAMRISQNETARIRIVASETANLNALGQSDDVRDLGMRVNSLVFHHPLEQVERLQGAFAAARDDGAAGRALPVFGPQRCPVCGESQVMMMELGPIEATHPGPFHVAQFRLLECTCCESVFLDPRPTPEDLTLLYQAKGQYSSSVYTDERRVAAILEYVTSVLDRLGPLPSRCLEIGAGLAWMSRACKARDARITTIAQDVSGEASRNCPWVDEYHVGSLETLPDSGPFDLISLTHVIEHLPDPMATLLYAAKRLAPGGRLFVTGPYRPAGDARAPLARWETYSYLHVPAHLTYLSERWFRRLAGESGLELESWDASHEGGDAFEAILRSKLPTDYTK